jgi:feruloyl esterase
MPRKNPTLGAGMVLVLLLSLGGSAATIGAGTAAALQSGPDAARCESLAAADFGELAGAPARVTSARLVDVPAADPKLPPTAPAALLAASPVKQYCQVQGYVAPQNKFELRLPLPAQWNGRFHLTPCAGFCGALNGNACNFTLARGYASITGNGGHDSPVGFDGVWAANSPNLPSPARPSRPASTAGRSRSPT